MESGKALARPGYLLAAMFFVIPLCNAARAMLPLHVSQEQWRFGAIGTLSTLTLSPLLAILLAMALALACDHRRIRRLLGWICALMAVVLAGLSVLFVLDFLQARTVVHPQFRHNVDVTSAIALGKLLLSVVVLVLFARVGVSGRRKNGLGTSSGESPTPLIPVWGATHDADPTQDPGVVRARRYFPLVRVQT